MISVRIYLIALFFIMNCNQSQAFMYSEIQCDSNTWFSLKKESKFVKKFLKLSFKKNEANRFTLLDKDNKAIVKIYPWAGIDFKLKKGIKIIQKSKKNPSFLKLKLKDVNGNIYRVSCQKT